MVQQVQKFVRRPEPRRAIQFRSMETLPEDIREAVSRGAFSADAYWGLSKTRKQPEPGEWLLLVDAPWVGGYIWSDESFRRYYLPCEEPSNV